ncbi:MAG TPA: FecR domain-containing protein [Pyrinomonadaceae bacterium]|jgi:ferric-dicitrate binding protein FerR (iron transport regulator)|nr:FecR domain-containing protein [Pyrinomonadaceae bacterium]
MKNSLKQANWIVRRLIALSVVMGVLNLSASGVFANSPNRAESLGTIQVSGGVTVNDVPATSGLTLTSGSYIVTSGGSSSILELGNLTRFLLSEQTELALDFSAESISGTLQTGGLHIFVPASRVFTINTPTGVIAADGSEMVAVKIQLTAGETRISVEQGRVELRSGNSKRWVLAGETLSNTESRSTLPIPQQNLSQGKRIGILAGIGGGLAILLLVLSGDRELDFGGCVITLSPIDGRPPC